MMHDGITIEGYSRAAVQSYWRVPELKLGFDLGGSPWDFMNVPTFLITHAHLDHMAALPVLVARRRMMKMEPPTIYVPEETREAVDRMLKCWQRLDRGRMICELKGVTPGEEWDLSRELAVSAFATKHTVPSVGYIVWQRRRKLLPQYQALPQDEIRKLATSGVAVSGEVRTPWICYTGDTAPAGFDAEPNVYKSRILITELTFFQPEHRREKIHKFGHTHLDDFIERAELFENELIIAAHFSTRSSLEQLQRAVAKRLPARLKDRFKLWL